MCILLYSAYMSLKSLFASMTLCVFLTSFCLAEGTATGPGKSIPADPVTLPAETSSLVLDSAPAEAPKFISLTDILVTPSAHTAEMVFSTNIPTYATIEYGLTAEHESALNTETMTAHSETLSGLTACRKYSYHVLVVDADDVTLDTSRDGVFTTTGCVAKKVAKSPKSFVTKTTTPTVTTSSAQPASNEPEVLNSAPESPDTPLVAIAPEKAPANNTTEIFLALFGLILLVGALIVVRRKK